MKISIKSLVILLLSICAFFACNKDDDNNEIPSLGNNATLTEVANSQVLWTGVTISKENRLFACFPRIISDTVPYQVAEVSGANATPFPDATWNTWNRTLPPQDHFISVQSVVIDDQNFLWVLDSASPQMKGVIPGGAKLLKFDLTSRQLLQRITFDETVVYPTTYLNDVRFDTQKGFAYITDSGKGGIIVVNLANGTSRRVLDKHFSTKSENILVQVEGKVWANQDESIPVVHSDGIALSPEKTNLYYHALTGRNLYRVGTQWLQDPNLTEAQLEEKVELVGNTGPVDGMIFGADSALYLTAVEQNAINRISKQGRLERVVQSEQLKWPDTFTVGPDGTIYVTSSQLHLGRQPQLPYLIFKVDINPNQ